MKRSRVEEGVGGESHRQYKHLKGAQLPAKIQAMPHIMARIDELAMSKLRLCLQAATANEIDWLRKLLPHLRHKMADVGRAIIKIAATHGLRKVFNLVDSWWAPEDEEGREEKFRAGCGDSLTKEIEGGHLAIICDLLEGYDCDYSAGLDLALKLGRDHAAAEIYQSVDDPYMVGHLRWAARHGKYAYEVCWDVSLSEAMGTAASRGHLEIVEFLLETCKYHMLRVERDRDASESPLAKAIMHGQVEIAKYLYARGGYADCSLDDVKVVVAARGPLELVIISQGRTIQRVFSWRGVRICWWWRKSRHHGVSTDTRSTSFNKTFMKAAIYGKTDAMELWMGT